MEKNENTDNPLIHEKAPQKQRGCHIINKSNGYLIGLAIRSHPKVTENALKKKG